MRPVAVEFFSARTLLNFLSTGHQSFMPQGSVLTTCLPVGITERGIEMIWLNFAATADLVEKDHDAVGSFLPSIQLRISTSRPPNI